MNHKTEIAIEAAVPSLANKTTICGAAMGVLGWLSSINWIGLFGVLVAVVGLMVNVYFQHRRDKREQRESDERIAALHAGSQNSNQEQSRVVMAEVVRSRRSKNDEGRQ